MLISDKRRDYFRNYHRVWRAKRRAACFIGKTCIDCGTDQKLEIDHRDPTQKIDHKIWSWREERRLAELAKCDIRCASCHDKRHCEPKKKHGGLRRYYAGCRCEPCKKAMSIQNARRIRRVGQPFSLRPKTSTC